MEQMNWSRQSPNGGAGQPKPVTRVSDMIGRGRDLTYIKQTPPLRVELFKKTSDFEN